MAFYVLQRLVQGFVLVWIVALVVFVALYVVGNPVDVLARPDAGEVERLEIARQLGLDQPIYVQYFVFIERAISGDLGTSFVFKLPALSVILARMPVTVELAFFGLAISILVGIPLGIAAGLKPTSWFGRAIMSGSIFGFSLPNFWVGLMLISIFAVQLKWLPAGGQGETVEVFGMPLAMLTLDGLRHLILPAVTLSLFKLALVIRIAQERTREVMGQDFIRFARARGLRPTRIVGVHLLVNLLVPLITILGLEFGSMIAFSVVTETVFAYPGMGKLLIDAIVRFDRPIIVAYLMLTVIVFVTINFVADILYAVVDPRVRLGSAGK